MTPPTNFGLDAVDAATIDGQSVRAVTMDGEQVFGGAIPDSVENRWQMSEGTGTTVADSVGSSDGTTDASWVADANSVGGTHLSFNASTDISVGVSQSRSAWFFSVWVNWDGSSGFNAITASDGNGFYPLIIDGSDGLIGMFDSGMVNTTSIAASDGWTHYLTTGDANGRSLWEDGSEVASDNTSTTWGNMSDIAQRGDGAEYYPGDLDDAMIGGVRADQSLVDALRGLSPRA